MTTVVYFDGAMASDSKYGNNFSGVDGFPNIPKVITYKNGNCEFICGCSGASNLMALAQDFFAFHFVNLSMENIGELIQELSSIIGSYVTEKQATSNHTLLELLLVIDGKVKVFYYNYGSNILLNPDQFPAIGSGSRYVKEVILTQKSLIELVQYAINKDSNSGGIIYTTGKISPNQPVSEAMVIEGAIKTKFLEQLDAMYA
ncbi:hypothetical protein C2869_19855 [Saccharobesus litoralis]|uniref:Uncharacterized protein n=1 Tax=Saccharobesus litoralis TaxID=2172099 RepID=A0A2S0VWE5_9ALTE|nr:hypothetical protein [Saccharobesus litoralis]AWB68515.1 hypothetical protein C2869_19855 [Saccharobesus litoralis]